MFGSASPLDTIQKDDKVSKHALPPVVWRFLEENSGFSRPKTGSLYPWKRKDAPFQALSSSKELMWSHAQKSACVLAAQVPSGKQASRTVPSEADPTYCLLGLSKEPLAFLGVRGGILTKKPCPCLSLCFLVALLRILAGNSVLQKHRGVLFSANTFLRAMAIMG